MSDNNVESQAGQSSEMKDLVERVRAIQDQLRKEKVDALLQETANPKMPMSHRESLANQAMWLLKDTQKSVVNGVDYAIPQPNFFRFQSVVPLQLPDYSLTKDAYSSNDTSTLFLRLEMISQAAVQSMRGPPLNADGTPAVLDATTSPVMGQINSLRSDVRETHYAVVALGLHLHYYLDWLFDQWGATKFLDAMTQVEGLLMAYNAYAPDFAIQFEENALRGMRVITGITHNIWEYLTSPVFYQVQQAKNAQEASVAPAAPVAAPPPPSTLPPSLYPTAIASPVSPLTAPSAAAPAAKVMRAEKKKGRRASVFAVKAADTVTIDLSPSRNPTDVIPEIEQLFTTYITEGLDTITQLKEAAQPINFNVFTNQFGSIASLTDNVAMLEEIRANILRYIADQFHPALSLEP
ncbi:MAG TPA: hypothetical protein VKK79_14925, partial [Candidatus Lokiarchaeia archaeon]|nr:hypothetical protein [Candidatus Lokiarchaeia archaeon]